MNQPQPPQPTYLYEQLASLILLHEKLTGEKPTELHVVPEFYTWFVQESARNLEDLKKYQGIEAKLPEQLQYLGVLIQKKVKIIK